MNYVTVYNIIAYENDRLYINGYQLIHNHKEMDEENNNDVYGIAKLYSVNVDGSDLKEIPLDTVKEEYIQQMVVGKDCNITLLIESLSGKEKILVRIDEKGQELARKSLGNIIKQIDNTGLIKLLVTDNEKIVLVTSLVIYLLDTDFNIISEIEVQGDIQDAAFSKAGNVICVVPVPQNDMKQTCKIKVLDLNKQEWCEEISVNVSSESDTVAVLNGRDAYDFYIKNDRGIYGYETETKDCKEVLNFASVNLTKNTAENIIVLKDGLFANIGYEDDEHSNIILYSPTLVSDITEKEIIVYGGLLIDEQIKSAVIAFNQENSEYQIEIKEYYDAQTDGSVEDALNKMNADIMAGNIPDIFDMNYVSAEQYIEKGIVEDLTPYIDADSEIHESDMVASVWEAMKINGKVYYVTPDFSVYAIVGKTKDIGEGGEWTVQQMLAWMEEQDPGTKLTFSTNKAYAFDAVFGNCLADYIDFETGTCRFMSQDFKNILEICNRSCAESADSIEEEYKSGKVLFMPASNITLLDMQKYIQLFGEDISFIGISNTEGNGSYFGFSCRMGIFAKSEVKDGAWTFVRSFLTKEYQQESGLLSYMPIRQDCFDNMIEEQTAVKAYTNDLGEEIQPVSGSWEWLGMNEEYRAVSREEVTKFIDLINRTRAVEFYDNQIRNIVSEEAGMYFTGDRGLEETVKVIQNRVELYLSE